MRYSVEAKDFLLFVGVRGKVGEQEVKERCEDDGFVTVSDEDEWSGVILAVLWFSTAE